MVMGGRDQPVYRLAVMRQGEPAQSKPEQAMPQTGRTLIDHEGRYRQIQREPDAHYFKQDRHDHLTVARVQ